MLSRQQSLWRRQRASSSTSSPADEAKADETRQGDDHELGGAVRERERRCWVCFEEDKDGSRRGEWRRPCPCNLEAHESCLVSWVNFSGRAKCPQCGQPYRILTPAPGIPLTLMWMGDSYTMVVATLFSFSTVLSGLMQWLGRYGHISSVFVGATSYDSRYFRPFSASVLPPFFSDYYDLRSTIVPLCLLEANLTRRRMYWSVWLPLALEARDWSIGSPATATACLPVLRSLYHSAYDRYLGGLERSWDLELGRDYAHGVILQPLLRPQNEREHLRWVPINIQIVREDELAAPQEDRERNEGEDLVDAVVVEREEDAAAVQAAEDHDAVSAMRSVAMAVLHGMRDVMAALMLPWACGVSGEMIMRTRVARRLPLSRYHWCILAGCGFVVGRVGYVSFLVLTV